MKLTRISRIQHHRIFDDFTWPAGLSDFLRFNLIYGWNGCGKTTLSNLCFHVQKKTNVAEGSVQFVFDALTVPGSSLAGNAALPSLRVFNRDFVAANFASAETEVGPIFYLGEDNVDQQRKIHDMKTDLAARRTILAQETAALNAADGAVESFATEKAKLIKELLTAPGGGPYNNYNKANFKTKASHVLKDVAKHQLSDLQKAALKTQKDAAPMSPVSAVARDYPDLVDLKAKAEASLAKTVVSQTIEALVAKPAVASWVKQGLALHGKHGGKPCEFCANVVSKERIAALEAHFNDEYDRFVQQLDGDIARIDSQVDRLNTTSFPVDGLLYSHLRDAFAVSKAALLASDEPVLAFLKKAREALAQKKGHLFEAIGPAAYFGDQDSTVATAAEAKLAAVNAIIEEHNSYTAHLPKAISDARGALEGSYVAEAAAKYEELTTAAKAAGEKVAASGAAIVALEKEIKALEDSLSSHRPPANELNAELASYLGRDELKFEAKETGYQVRRGHVAAANLSEGERTAVAFLYFLKTLKDMNVKGEDCIVVIDDPVSSLDTNALFCAFGYMRDRTKGIGQLFVLTHNFGFFRLVKNWFKHLNARKKPNKHQAAFYMLDDQLKAGTRNAVLRPLDELLKDYESEYHYLFKKVWDEAHREPPHAELERYYTIPNIARRLLESFLSFRFPAEAAELSQQFDRIADVDPAKKARILRLLHTYSHDGKVPDTEHDYSALAETPAVLKDLIELLVAVDKNHVEEMKKLIVPPAEEPEPVPA